ncbi:galactonate dehydratase [Haladaptatus paucihalophilus DX253]|uniref:Galactonate dehydratase n=1 Tax=Haladaptatus paucihalophilus DX253 TaxID=797209 RepID=E7QPC5_HALPU|nr:MULTISPECIES: galactonate dehydratase [Haladaptatus]EFW94041.1 galactonate dehydratase [Haladaptatus paucihalophilus DX253]GKZ13106.1 galactonate dehydratase [Haladaptatus sp. T7]SHK63630.1 galactonate dehydratase [Haladaptatus paucihalophilus DX253]
MRITDYELFAVPPRWLFLKLETSNGLVGWGEPTIQGRLETVQTAVDELVSAYLLGEDPLEVERHWRTMYQGGYYRGGPILMSALAGIDHALWDIKGKHYGAPVHELLGGQVRDRVLVHQWIGGEDREAIAKEAISRRNQGYKAIKMNATAEFRALEPPGTVERVRKRVATVRDAVGDDLYLGVDFHGRVSKPMVRRLVETLESYGLMFIDQPVLPEHSGFLSTLTEQTSVPIATGERFYSRYDFKPLLVEGAVTVIQPDVTHVGGITELRKIATMAEAFDVAVIPHCPLSPIAFAATLQVVLCSHNGVMQEQDLSFHDPAESVGLQYLDDPETFEFDDGYVSCPTEPGLGIEVDESYVREQSRADVKWYNPVWRHEDGGIAEW